MKYNVTLHVHADMFAVVEVEAEDEEEARELALEKGEELYDADFEVDTMRYDTMSTEDVTCAEE